MLLGTRESMGYRPLLGIELGELMSRRRFWLSICVALLMLLSLLICFSGYRLQQLLEEQRIELDWRSLSLSWRGVLLHDVSLTQRLEGELHLQSEQLQLYWLASETPRYRALAQGLQLNWQPAQTNETQPHDNGPGDALQSLAAALPWLPRQIEVRSATAHLPCASGQCILSGDLLAQHLDDALQVRLQLLRDTHHASLQARLNGLGTTLDSVRQLHAAVQLDDQQQLELHSDLSPRNEALQWSGNLQIAPLPDIAWVSNWLSEWLPLAPQDLPATPQQAGVNTQWQLHLPRTTRQLAEMMSAPGWLNIDAHLPSPWPLPGLGLISGDLTLELRNDNTRWQARQAQGELLLTPQNTSWLQALPAGLQPEQVRLEIAPLPDAAENELALELKLSTQGPLELQANAELGLRQYPDWALEVAQLQLQAHSKRLDLASNRVDDLQLALSLTGNATAQQLQLRLGKDSRLDVRRLRADELELQRIQASLADMELSGAPASPQLSGLLTLRAQRLQHPQLLPQGWQWQGQLQANESRQALEGAVLADSGLSMALNLDNTLDELRVDATLDELFLRAGNPLRQLLSSWPALLTLDNGRMQGSAQMRLPRGKPMTLQANLSGRNLAGIYDRSTLSGIEGEVQLRVNGDRLSLELPNLSARQIDPGIPLGPLELQGSYSASLAQPTTGTLVHRHAELGILGGSLSLAPATWELQRPSQLLPLRLSGLDLQELFRTYPAEGLEGNGLIDGNLPLRVGQSISIEQGHIEARSPGGQLRFHSPRIRAMGQANPGMKLVTDALEDFHYDLLDGSVDYNASGTLQLGLRLHGQNPAIEQGRPINFNINLQEDIPSLLASLQLTDKVSDIIQQRIQQWMRQRVPQKPQE
ncbi:YdbH domain-containing protein [Pseudomonas sp. SH1-B]